MARRVNRMPLTNEERDARRQADRDRIEQAARALLTTDGWQRWIKVRATNGLSRYSVTNLCLISAACHACGITPTYGAGFRAFLDLNRCSASTARRQRAQRRGRGHRRKRIFFRTVPVFDVQMTHVLPGSPFR